MKKVVRTPSHQLGRMRAALERKRQELDKYSLHASPTSVRKDVMSSDVVSKQIEAICLEVGLKLRAETFLELLERAMKVLPQDILACLSALTDTIVNLPYKEDYTSLGPPVRLPPQDVRSLDRASIEGSDLLRRLSQYKLIYFCNMKFESGQLCISEDQFEIGLSTLDAFCYIHFLAMRLNNLLKQA